jgi:hypothetical protein
MTLEIGNLGCWSLTYFSNKTSKASSIFCKCWYQSVVFFFSFSCSGHNGLGYLIYNLLDFWMIQPVTGRTPVRYVSSGQKETVLLLHILINSYFLWSRGGGLWVNCVYSAFSFLFCFSLSGNGAGGTSLVPVEILLQDFLKSWVCMTNHLLVQFKSTDLKILKLLIQLGL